MTRAARRDVTRASACKSEVLSRAQWALVAAAMRKIAQTAIKSACKNSNLLFLILQCSAVSIRFGAIHLNKYDSCAPLSRWCRVFSASPFCSSRPANVEQYVESIRVPVTRFSTPRKIGTIFKSTEDSEAKTRSTWSASALNSPPPFTSPRFGCALLIL